MHRVHITRKKDENLERELQYLQPGNTFNSQEQTFMILTTLIKD